MNSLLNELKAECREELIHGILPFWINKIPDPVQGGFYGRISGDNSLHTNAHKGGILNARILWTFSAAYRTIPDTIYLRMATRAYDYCIHYFFDTTNGGTYWMLNPDGSPAQTKKQIYSQAFFIYALSEYYQATGNIQALEKAKELYYLIEKYSFDKKNNGYLEAFSNDWKLLDDLRLSEKDDNDEKTMNTHLHILEAYTNLYRVWKCDELYQSLKNLIILFEDKIVSPSGHLILFFNKEWQANDHIHSYGHDIEASWLLYEAAFVLGEEQVTERIRLLALKIAEITVTEGLQSDGSIWYEKDTTTGYIDKDRHWWPQAEAVVGFLYAWKLTDDDIWLNRSTDAWNYIKEQLIDKENGEWYWSIRNGIPNKKEDKAGFWKCPYHNSRMCLEVMNIV